MRHVLSALVVNRPGVLAHISGMLASREYNIDSLAVGATENPEFSRMTFVVAGDEHQLDQVRKQLEKIVTVVKVIDYSKEEYVERDLMLIKVATAEGSLRQRRRSRRPQGKDHRHHRVTAARAMPKLRTCATAAVNVVIGQRPGSPNYDLAVSHGFKPMSAAEATKQADVVNILLPDEVQGDVYRNDIRRT
jgi:acetolactate synthase small subunit